ncbi:MAG: NAD(P)/FAD-dependent oxidoreductase [Chloroflexota bacterium]
MIRQRQVMLGTMLGLGVGLFWLLFTTLAQWVSGQPPIFRGLGEGAFFLVGCWLLGIAVARWFETAVLTPTTAATNGFALGAGIWVSWGVIVQPLFFDVEPSWQATEMLAKLPHLVAYLLAGLLIGWGHRFIRSRWGEAWTMAETSSASQPTKPKRILILGGGYAGVTAAQTLERELANEPAIEIYLISQTNYLVHTPMLSEVSASSVNAQNISPPLRSFFQRVRVIQGGIAQIDMAQRVVVLTAGSRSRSRQLPFDHLLLTVGSEPNFFGNKGVERHALGFKTLQDAMRLRNRVIEMFERADLEPEASVRRQMLTFVVAGGGFAGVELIGGLNDFTRGILPFYPEVNADEVRLVLVHSRELILPELSDSLGRFAQEKLAGRGVEFMLNTRVVDAEADKVWVREKGTETAVSLPSNTFVWTAGNKPAPILETLGLPLERGRIRVNVELAVSDAIGLWAAGDCAVVPDLTNDGKPAPPTAQHALREGKVAGYNIAASLQGKPLKTFKFKTLGLLAALGHQLAVAELFGYRFSGFLAWLMWRAIYLSKLPTFEKQLRVGLDWLLDLFFPADIVQTVDFMETSKDEA